MITLTRPQRNALVHMAEHGCISQREGASIRTMRVLRDYGLAIIAVSGTQWTATITTPGRRWISNRAANADARHRDDVAADRRTEYRRRAAAYVTAAVPVLERLDGPLRTNRRAIEIIRNVPHPGRTPARLESAGWMLYDDNHDGYEHYIARALIEIGESCAYGAYPIGQDMLDRLTDHETTLSDIIKQLGMDT